MARRQCHRSKPRKRPNRYDPNAPDWRAVHAAVPFVPTLPLPGRPVAGLGLLDAVLAALRGRG